MTDVKSPHDKGIASNRTRFIDLAMDGIVLETLRIKKEQQLDHLKTTLPELCAAAHFVDGSADVETLINAWNEADQADRITPPDAVSVETDGGFPTHQIIERILRRSIGAVRSLPMHRAHKPMFTPYPQEIDAALKNNSVHVAFTTLFNAMLA